MTSAQDGIETIDQAAAALGDIRASIPRLAQDHPDLNEFLPAFHALWQPLLARAGNESVRRYLLDEMELILVELRAWNADPLWSLA
ncbi:MAG TPA: hypothetical protein VEY50_12185 [Lysobacter sp.]|nr:hypothetical protein [Lysobacter sp.]